MDKRISILHVVQSAGYGVTVYVESLIKNLPKNQFQQALLASEYYDNDYYKSLVDRLTTIKMDRNITVNDFKTILRCRKIVLKEKPDILYCHSAKAGIYGRIAAIGTGIKVVYNPHGWAFNMHCNKLKRLFYMIIEIIFSFFTDKIIAISNFEKESTPGLIPRKKIVSVLNGIDIDRDIMLLQNSEITRAVLGIDENDFVIGLIARISRQKGQDLLVRAAKDIIRHIPNCIFLLVGGKSDDIPIEKIIEENELKKYFIITGEVNNAIQYANLFDIAVLTSRWEGFGLVLPEYMLAKCPIVAFDVDAVSEIVKNGCQGILVDAENIRQLSEAIIKLYKNKNLRNLMGENGYLKAINEFNIKRVCKEHELLFKSLCPNK